MLLPYRSARAFPGMTPGALIAFMAGWDETTPGAATMSDARSNAGKEMRCCPEYVLMPIPRGRLQRRRAMRHTTRDCAPSWGVSVRCRTNVPRGRNAHGKEKPGACVRAGLVYNQPLRVDLRDLRAFE